MKKQMKKTWDVFKDSFFIAVLIDFIFIITAFLNFYFAGNIVRDNVLLIYSLGGKLTEFKDLLSENAANLSLIEIGNTLELLDKASGYIIWTTVFSFILFFLLWCFFKSFVWKYSYEPSRKKLFKNFWKSYLPKFSVVSFIMFVILMPLFWFLVNISSSFVLSVKEYDFNLAGFLIFLVIFLFLFLLVLYLFNVTFVYLNKYKVKEALKKGFLIGIKKPLVFFGYLGVWILILFVLYLDKMLYGFGKWFMVFDLAFILLVMAFYRFWFCSYFGKLK